MTVRHGIVTNELVKLVAKPPATPEAETDDELKDIIEASYWDWIDGGRKRSLKDNAKCHVVIVDSTIYQETLTRLRRVAKESGYSLQIGSPYIDRPTDVIIPIVAKDKLTRHTTQEITSATLELSGDDWKLVLRSLRFMVTHSAHDPMSAQASQLVTRIETAIGDSLPIAEVRQLQG